MPEPKNRHQHTRARDAVIRELGSCATEQDVVQVLYADLHPAFGYDTISLQVLEREGWYHSLAVQRGVLQDTCRQQLAGTSLGDLYEQGRTSVLDVEANGWADAVWLPPPGAGRRPRLGIWVPVHRLGRPVGAVAYQLDRRRPVPDEELAVLEEIHGSLAVVLAEADGDALTRNQALRLSVLNAIGRNLSTTLDEQGVAVALRDVLAQFLPVARLELSLLEGEDRGRARVLAVEEAGRPPSRAAHGLRARRLAGVRHVLTRGETVLSDPPGEPSRVAVPVLEQGVLRGALAITSSRPHSYERSTVAFLQQVAYHAGLALCNTWTYAALEAQRRRLEVVNAIGRRLASSLDRWSIMRTLREELARHVEFDMFALAPLEQTHAGPVAAGFVYDSGVERPIEGVPLELAGPRARRTRPAGRCSSGARRGTGLSSTGGGPPRNAWSATRPCSSSRDRASTAGSPPARSSGSRSGRATGRSRCSRCSPTARTRSTSGTSSSSRTSGPTSAWPSPTRATSRTRRPSGAASRRCTRSTAGSRRRPTSGRSPRRSSPPRGRSSTRTAFWSRTSTPASASGDGERWATRWRRCRLATSPTWRSCTAWPKRARSRCRGTSPTAACIPGSRRSPPG